jgi:hypothetical protein
MDCGAFWTINPSPVRELDRLTNYQPILPPVATILEHCAILFTSSRSSIHPSSYRIRIYNSGRFGRFNRIGQMAEGYMLAPVNLYCYLIPYQSRGGLILVPNSYAGHQGHARKADTC